MKGRGAAGVHTVEGNAAGSRAGQLAAQRAKEQAAFDDKKRKIEDLHAAPQVQQISARFTTKDTLGAQGAADAKFKSRTMGMVTLDEYRSAKEGKKTADEVAEESRRAAKMKSEKELMRKKKKEKKKKRKKRKLNTLSFGEDMLGSEGEEEVEAEAKDDKQNNRKKMMKKKKKKVGKDPTIVTSFLPDRDREAASKALRQKLEQEWHANQAKMKLEKLQVTYSYWDGSGHRRNIVIEKGFTIAKFLEAVRMALCGDFSELRIVNTGDLMYVKEDLIIPHQFSFYDLIISKARGKSGPLFHFDVHDDVRLLNDARVEKDESHPGKIVLRRWFEKNKHIFPASRWEVYDPARNSEREKYTIHGGEVRGNGARRRRRSSGGGEMVGGETATVSAAQAGIWSVGANL